MGTKRKQGQKYDNGHTKNQILLILCEHPEGIEEPEIRDIIKWRLRISESKGLRDHLTDLENKRLLFKNKGQVGKANKWFPEPVAFSTLAKRFLNTNDELTFHASAYCQSMITPTLLREIEKIWDVGHFPSKTVTDSPDVFTEEDILEILRQSPTALKRSLENPLEDISSERFEERLLASFLLDNHNYKIEAEISVRFCRPGIKPFFKKCKSRTLTIMPGEY
jgi:hypothetical protein